MKYQITWEEVKDPQDLFIRFNSYQNILIYSKSPPWFRSKDSFEYAMKTYPGLSKESCYQYVVDNYDRIIEEVKSFLVKDML